MLLRAHKDLILDLHRQGVQPLIKEGWIDPNKLFSTIGVIGLPEAHETLTRKVQVNNDVIAFTLQLMNKLVYDLSKEFNLAINIEQIPGESARFNLCTKDKARFGEENVPYVFYANQFCPLTKQVELFEKIDIEGSYYNDLTGGGIAHLRCSDRPTAQQFTKIIEYALNAGCGHIAFSAVYSICSNNHVTVGKYEHCPTCGNSIDDYLERIVGYHQRVGSWGKKARELDFHARQFLLK
jgi:anaerobic ribonucleoside-triphosphate reductase